MRKIPYPEGLSDPRSQDLTIKSTFVVGIHNCWGGGAYPVQSGHKTRGTNHFVQAAAGCVFRQPVLKMFRANKSRTYLNHSVHEHTDGLTLTHNTAVKICPHSSHSHGRPESPPFVIMLPYIIFAYSLQKKCREESHKRRKEGHKCSRLNCPQSHFTLNCAA